MAHLNFKHLRYFWAVGKAGSIVRAAAHLHLTPQSISGQLAEFEAAQGVKLFRRVGRNLELTETGRRMLGYAEQIFSLADEMLRHVHESAEVNALPFHVGIADSVPKTVAYRVVEPSLSLAGPIRLVCREGSLTSLLAELAVHRLDLVIADRPMPGNLNVRGYSHFLGESGVTLFGARSLRKGGKDFPELLQGAPLLLPGAETALRARLERWLTEQQLRPTIVGEFDDNALAQAFGQAGAGYFFGPTALEEDIARRWEVDVVGRIADVREQLFAITNERKLSHPIVLAISHRARREIFGERPDEATLT